MPMPQSSSHVRAWSTTAPLHFRQQERTGLVGQLFPYVAHRGAIPQQDQGIDNLPRNLVHNDRILDQWSGATSVHQRYRATTWCTKRPPVEQVCKCYRVQMWRQYCWFKTTCFDYFVENESGRKFNFATTPFSLPIIFGAVDCQGLLTATLLATTISAVLYSKPYFCFP